jgi:hypothetical protein
MVAITGSDVVEASEDVVGDCWGDWESTHAASTRRASGAQRRCVGFKSSSKPGCE